MTMTETVDATARVTARTSLPLFVDAGAGWGEAVHVRRTVQELERAGAAVIQIEDQYFPKRMEYHAGIEDICDRAEFVDRVKTCVGLNPTQGEGRTFCLDVREKSCHREAR
jgi:2-methylisocitrate lyase-like PEP mutase family enzyme